MLRKEMERGGRGGNYSLHWILRFQSASIALIDSKYNIDKNTLKTHTHKLFKEEMVLSVYREEGVDDIDIVGHGTVRNSWLIFFFCFFFFFFFDVCLFENDFHALLLLLHLVFGSRTGRARSTVGEPVVHVLTVRTRMREPLEAFLTLEGFLTAVQPLVLRQMVLVLERFGAHVALVRTLTYDTMMITNPNRLLILCGSGRGDGWEVVVTRMLVFMTC